MGVLLCQQPPFHNSLPAGERVALPWLERRVLTQEICPVLSLACLSFCRPSSDARLFVPPPGLVGLLYFHPFSIPFPELCPLPWPFLGKSSVATFAVVSVLQNQQEQDGPGRVQGASKPRDLPADFLRVSGGISQVWS